MSEWGPKEYWENLFRESQVTTHLVFGGILVTYVGFALSREGMDQNGLLNLLALLGLIHLFVKLSFAFPRDALNADMHPAVAIVLQFTFLLALVAGTAFVGSKLGLNGDVLIAIQSSWILLSTVDFTMAKGGAKIGSKQND